MTPEERIERLLNWITEPASCKGCSCKIWFIKTKGGKLMPIQADGECHFGKCPLAEHFRRPVVKGNKDG